MAPMRIALVTPYSWTYPGGVTRHIEALGTSCRNWVTMCGSWRPSIRPTGGRRGGIAVPPAGARAARVAGRRWAARWASRPTARSPTCRCPTRRTSARCARAALRRLRRRPRPRAGHARRRLGHADELRRADGRHVPLLRGDRAVARDRDRHRRAAALNRLKVRIAVSEAAEWTGERFYGGRYRVVPNGVPCPTVRAARRAERDHGRRAAAHRVRRPGRRAQGPAGAAARLRGAARARPGRADDRRRDARGGRAAAARRREGVTVLGKVDDATKTARAARRRRAGAPSLGGESFGMVLTEAFAAGTPVVASDIAGYRDVVRTASTACSCRAATRARWARRCAPWPWTTTAPRRDGRRGAGERQALRVAGRRRRGRQGLRGRDRRRRAGGSPRSAPPSASARCRRTGCSRAARRGGCRRSSRAPRARVSGPCCVRAPRPDGPGRGGDPRGLVLRAAADRAGPDRPLALHATASWVLVRRWG